MKKGILILLLLVCSKAVFAQVSNEENKFLTTLLYLKTNKEINNTIRNYFKRDLKKTKFRKDDFLLFNVSETIYYQPIIDFKDKFDNVKYDLEKERIEDRSAYKEKYNFETFKSSLLGKVMPKTASPLCLSFSKPTERYLLAEFSANNFCSGDSETNVRRGTFLHLLILFDDDGAIEKIHSIGFHYN